MWNVPKTSDNSILAVDKVFDILNTFGKVFSIQYLKYFCNTVFSTVFKILLQESTCTCI